MSIICNNITNYKSKKDDNIDQIVYFFKKLLINIPQDLSINIIFVYSIIAFINSISYNLITLANLYYNKFNLTNIIFLNNIIGFDELTYYNFIISTNLYYNKSYLT